MKRGKERLLEKMQYHEDKANEYYEVIKAIEDKERLIGFKTQHDERGSTDGAQLLLSNRTTIEKHV